MNRRDVGAMTLLGLVGAGIPLWMVAAAGAIGVPSNDDLVYMRGAKSLFRTGVMDMPGAKGLAWYYDVFPAESPCAVLSNSPLDMGGFRPIHLDRSAFLQYLAFGPAEPLYLYGSLAAACPQPPAGRVRIVGGTARVGAAVARG